MVAPNSAVIVWWGTLLSSGLYASPNVGVTELCTFNLFLSLCGGRLDVHVRVVTDRGGVVVAGGPREKGCVYAPGGWPLTEI